MRIGLQAYVHGSVDAVAFYRRAFGASLGYHVFHDDGTFLHAELELDRRLLLAVSESASPVGLENVHRYSPAEYPTMNFGVNLGSEEAVRKAYDVLVEGANVLLPLGPLPWNPCCANLVDRFGVFWYIAV